MSTLLVLRHAQANFRQEAGSLDGYDVLSPLGEEQAAVLGRLWAKQKRRIDRVYVGPRRRHRQTLDLVAAAYHDAGLPWPEATLLDELDEHHGTALVDRLLSGSATEGTPEEVARRYLKSFQTITRQWVNGEIKGPAGIESWADFRRRIAAALERVGTDRRRGETIALFTSGGPVAAILGEVLGLGDETVLELSWRVRNTSCTRVLFSRKRWTLDTFNTHPHLCEPRLVTWI